MLNFVWMTSCHRFRLPENQFCKPAKQVVFCIKCVFPLHNSTMKLTIKLVMQDSNTKKHRPATFNQPQLEHMLAES